MGKQLNKRLFRMFLSLIDLILLYASFLLSFFILFNNSIPARNWDAFVKIAPWVGLAAILIFYFFDLYARADRKNYLNFIYSILLSVGFLMVVMVAMSFWARGFAMPRSVIVLGTIILAVKMIVVRTLIWYVQLRIGGRRKVLIIGKNMQDGMVVADKLLEHTKGWFDIKAFLNIHRKQSLPDYMDQIDVVLLTPELTKEEKAEILSYASGKMKEVLIVPDLYELFLVGAEPQQIDDMLVFSVMPPNLSPGELFMKRTMDILISMITLVVCSPVIIFLWIAIPMTSRGKAIYKQDRIGKSEKNYTLYKFRSMMIDAEKETGPVLAANDDPRVTKLGKLMRSTRLDELPQLFNVLKGDMSLVGPRPERAYFINRFKKEIPDYHYRMAVKPGVSGLAQVVAKYSSTVDDKLRYDLMYIRNYTLMLDVKILFQTILVVFRGKQAAGIKDKDPVREKALRNIITAQPEVAAWKGKKKKC